MMGFFNFLGKKNNESKKKTGGIKKQVMQVLNPKIAAADYYASQRKKRVIVILKKNLVKNNLEVIFMQYFIALKLGQKRVNDAREYLNKFANGKAMPALALKDNKTNVWEPVGEENYYAVVNGASGFVVTDDGGYILVLCDKNGIAKTIAQGLSDEEKTSIIDSLKSDNIDEYFGDVSLPV